MSLDILVTFSVRVLASSQRRLVADSTVFQFTRDTVCSALTPQTTSSSFPYRPHHPLSSTFSQDDIFGACLVLDAGQLTLSAVAGRACPLLPTSYATSSSGYEMPTHLRLSSACRLVLFLFSLTLVFTATFSSAATAAVAGDVTLPSSGSTTYGERVEGMDGGLGARCLAH